MSTTTTHRRIAAGAAALAAGLALGPPAAPAQDRSFATADFHDAKGELVGSATLHDWPAGVLIELQLSGLTPGEHALHIHETGRCEPGFSAAGGHYAPEGNAHGFISPDGPHAGDLPNLFFDTDGVAGAHVFNARVSLDGEAAPLLDEDGSALIVHARPDAYEETSGAGGRVACAVIEPGL